MWTGGDGARHSHQEVARPDFLDDPPRHPDLCLWYVRLWPHAAEDKSSTAFLAPDASMVLSILMAAHHTVRGRLLVLFPGLRIPKSLHPMGWYPHRRSYLLGRGSFDLSALCDRTLWPFQGAIPGAFNTRRAFRGLYPVKPDGCHIPRAFATILSTWCVLFARWGVAAALPGVRCCRGLLLSYAFAWTTNRL